MRLERPGQVVTEVTLLRRRLSATAASAARGGERLERALEVVVLLGQRELALRLLTRSALAARRAVARSAPRSASGKPR